MELKKYQKKAVERINEYLAQLNEFRGNPRNAFISIISKEKESFKYHEDFGDTPFVCVKIPTGGGKTFVACHSVIEIMTNYLKEKLDKGIVMWFVPSEAIKTQTLKKFKDSKDIHRKVLNEAFGNNVKIFSNEEALRIKKQDVEDNLCIVIASLEAFRKEAEKRGNYKVYKENGELIQHFENLQSDEGLEKDESGVIYSLANVIRKSNPLIVIDEGHKTKTVLSIDFLKDLNPSFIIEYTATPRVGSNVLVEIPSQDLKEEQMVKIPIVLESSREWTKAIDDGFVQRLELEKIAKKDKDHIRPIALFQAEPDRSGTTTITVETIKNYLIKDKKVSEEEIAIKTSKQNDLEGVNLFAKNCKIKYIITINALAEGWDCAFAYVLVSVANLGSKIAVEQIIGRILRMPYAKKRENDNLNKSYVFASAKNFDEAATQIIKGLEDNGFSKGDVIKSSEKDKKSPYEVSRRFKEDLKVPVFAYENEKLSFGEHLLGEDFELAKQDYKFDFTLPLSQDGVAEIDIKDSGEWWTGRVKQLTLNISSREKNSSESDLILWLDKKIRLKEIDMKDKVAYIKKVLDYQMSEKKKTLYELSINRYPLKDQIDKQIKKVTEDYAKRRFDEFLKKGKIKLKEFDKFPENIEVAPEALVKQDYKKSYYESIDKLNKEEKAFIDKLDLDELSNNFKFWVRCREKKKDAFALQGWENRNFYPDFVAVTKKGNLIAFEWKGEDRTSNDDTKYKEALGEVWKELGKGKLHFFLVHNGNVDKVIEEVREL